MLGERSQIQKSTVGWFHVEEMSRLRKSIKTDSRPVAAGTGGKRAWGVTANGYGTSFRGDQNVLELDSGNGCTTL